MRSGGRRYHPGVRSDRRVALAVDDEVGRLEAYRIILQDDFEVLTAEDGAVALDIFRRRPVDLVLLDLLMPGLSGLAVLEQLKALDPGVPVIVVTGLDRARTALDAIRLGAADVVIKPFEPESLLALARAVADRAAPAGPVPAPLPGILIVGGDRGLRAALAVVLRRRGRVETVPTLTRAVAEVARWMPAIVIADLRALEMPPAAALAALRHRLAVTPFIALVSEPGPPPVSPPGAVTVVLRGPLDVRRLLDETAILLGEAPGAGSGSRIVAKIIERVSVEYPHAKVQRLADMIGVSSDYISRLFHHEVGMTVSDYVTRVRIEVAKYLFGETQEKSATIAEMVGLYDDSHLARVFRRYALGPPRSYRRA